MTLPNVLKQCLLGALLAAGSGALQGAAIESISFDLSSLHAGSTLSGSVTLPTALTLGNSTAITLAFSDPADYTPGTLATTLTVSNGTTGDAFFFSPITFTNVANSKMYTLMAAGAAQCQVDFPCQATGGFQANSPPAFSAKYTISAASAGTATPEPSYGLLVACAIFGIASARFWRSTLCRLIAAGSSLPRPAR